MGRHSIPDPEDSADADLSGGSDVGGDQYPDDGRYVDDQNGTTSEDVADDYEAHDYDTDDYDTDDDYRSGDDGPARGGAPDAEFWQPDAGSAESGYDYSYLEEPEPATQAFASTPPPANRRDWESSEWTGSHRAIQPQRRGISVGVIVALVTVVVVVGAVIAWRFFGDALSNRSEAGAARCVAGEVDVAVIADPSIADAITPIADEYNQSADPVGDRCVKVGVKSADSDQVLNGFVGPWPGDLGERPALWIPGSSISEARLEAVDRREGRQRQPVVGHLAGDAGRAATDEECPGATELGHIARPAEQSDVAGGPESVRLGIPATGTAADG